MTSQKNKIFKEYYGEEQKPQPRMNDKKVAEYDTDKRQAPLKVFRKVGRDDYSYKKQMDRIEDFGIHGNSYDALVEKIHQVNGGYW